MADDESKNFSLSEAERLRAKIEPILIEAMEARRKMAELDQQLGALAERIQRSGGMQVPYEKTAQGAPVTQPAGSVDSRRARKHPLHRVHREGSRRRTARFSVAPQ